MPMSYRDLENIVNYSERIAQKEAARKARSDKVFRSSVKNAYGMMSCNRNRLANKRSVAYNGGFEYNSPLDVNPVGWTFTNAHGVVLDFASQPTDPGANWGGSLAIEGRDPVQGVHVRSGSTLNDIYLINGTSGAPFSSEHAVIDRVENSGKFLLVQSISKTSGYYSASTTVPTGVLKSDTFFYLDFYVMGYGGFLPSMFLATNGERRDFQPSESYKMVGGDYRFPLMNPPQDFAGSVRARVDFYDITGGQTGSIYGDQIPIAPSGGWFNPTYILAVPAGVSRMDVVFEGRTFSSDNPTSFLLDNVAVYPEQPVLKAGSIETHVINFSDSSTQGPQIRSDSYIYGVRTLYTDPPAASNHRLSNNEVTMDHPPVTSSLASKDRGFASVNQYVNAGDVLRLELTAGLESEGIAYIDLSTI